MKMVMRTVVLVMMMVMMLVLMPMDANVKEVRTRHERRTRWQ